MINKQKSTIKTLIPLYLSFIIVFANIDILLPVSSLIAKGINIPVESVIKVSTWYFFGLTLSSIIFGFVSDIYSYKRILVFGLSIFCIATILLYSSHNFSSFIFLRLLQGIGGGAISVIVVVKIFSLLEGAEAVKAINNLNMTLTSTLILSPILGVFISNMIGWRSIFLLEGILGIFATLGVVIYINHDKRCRITPRRLFVYYNQYKKIVTNHLFLQYLFLSAFQYAILLIYIVLLPVFSQKLFFVSPEEVGIFQSCSMLIFLFGNLLFHRFIRRGFSFTENICSYLIVISIPLVFVSFFYTNIYTFALPFYLLIIAVSMLLNIAVYKRVKISTKMKASNYALGIFLRYFLSAFFISLITYFKENSYLIFTVTIVFLCVASISLLASTNYFSKTSNIDS